MKRTVVGIVLLIVLLVGGILSAVGLSRHNEKVASRLDTAARLAMAGDLQGAMDTSEEARAIWVKGRRISAAFLDHTPLDQIDVGFTRLQLYGEAGDQVAFTVICGELSEQIEALGDANGAQWWNIL